MVVVVLVVVGGSGGGGSVSRWVSDGYEHWEYEEGKKLGGGRRFIKKRRAQKREWEKEKEDFYENSEQSPVLTTNALDLKSIIT